jgi:rubrerythrin
MARFVKVADVIAAAVEIENRGHAFYLRARDQAQPGGGREFFAFMAEEELKHREMFEAMLRRVEGLTLPAGASEEEYFAYVQASLDSHLLFMEGAPVGGDPYRIAMDFEKDTIVYFLSMLDLVPPSETKHVQRCIEEEKKHLLLIHRKRGERAKP